MLGNINAGFPGNQFQGFMISGNNNSAFMGGVPCLTPPPVTYGHMLSIQSAHLRAMSGFFNGNDAVFSPINNTVQFAGPQQGMNEIPPGTLPNHVDDYAPGSKVHYSPAREYNCPPGTLPNHVDDYAPRQNYSGSAPSYDVPAGTLPNHVADYAPGRNYSGSAPSYDVPAGTLPNHVADYAPGNTNYSGSAPSYDVPAGTLPNHVADYAPSGTGLSRSDEPAQNDYSSSNTGRPGTYRYDSGISHSDKPVRHNHNRSHSERHGLRTNYNTSEHDITREEVEANVRAREASAPVYVTGNDGKINTYYPNGDGTYYKQTRTGGKEYNSSGEVNVYHKRQTANADGDLEVYFVKHGHVSLPTDSD